MVDLLVQIRHGAGVMKIHDDYVVVIPYEGYEISVLMDRHKGEMRVFEMDNNVSHFVTYIAGGLGVKTCMDFIDSRNREGRK
jgi:hypothetical protein